MLASEDLKTFVDNHMRAGVFDFVLTCFQGSCCIMEEVENAAPALPVDDLSSIIDADQAMTSVRNT